MNKQIKEVFSNIKRELGGYQAGVAAALSAYRRDLGAAGREASRYKDESGELARRKEGLISATRAEIGELDKALRDAVVQNELPKLRAAMSEYICQKPDRDFLEIIRTVKAFDLALTRAELEGYILAAGGNYTALRCLQAVAKGSGYQITAPSAEWLESDLEGLERAVRVPVMYAPADYVHEALDVLEDYPVFRADGTVAYTTGRPDAVSLLLRAQELQEVIDDLDAAGDRWAYDFVPEITTFETIIDDEGVEITSEQQRAEAVKAAAERIVVKDEDQVTALAQQVAREQAEADRQAAEGLKYYL